MEWWPCAATMSIPFAPPPPWLLLASFRSNPRSLQNREEEKKAQARTKLRRDGNPIGISTRVQANWWFFTERSEKYAASKDDETEEASFFVAKVSPLNGKENSSKPKNLRTVLALLSPPPTHKKNEYSPSPACLWENSCYKNTENHKKIYQEDCTPRVNLLVVFRLCFAGGILLRRLRILRQRNDTDLGRLESLGVWVCVWLTLFLSLSLALVLLAQFADPQTASSIVFLSVSVSRCSCAIRRSCKLWPQLLNTRMLHNDLHYGT